MDDSTGNGGGGGGGGGVFWVDKVVGGSPGGKGGITHKFVVFIAGKWNAC